MSKTHKNHKYIWTPAIQSYTNIDNYLEVNPDRLEIEINNDFIKKLEEILEECKNRPVKSVFLYGRLSDQGISNFQ